MRIIRFGKEFDVVDSLITTNFWKRHFQKGWEEKTFQFLFKHFDKNKTFIDIGSWIAPISIIASYFSKNVIAIEPDPVSFNQMVQNIELNKIKNIIPINKAVSIFENISLGNIRLGKSTTRTGVSQNAFNPECISIKKLFGEYQLTKDNISVLKMDIEGHEEYLLQDELLINLDVPMHISFHPMWFKDKTLKSVDKFVQKKLIELPVNVSEFKQSFETICE